LGGKIYYAVFSSWKVYSIIIIDLELCLDVFISALVLAINAVGEQLLFPSTISSISCCYFSSSSLFCFKKRFQKVGLHTARSKQTVFPAFAASYYKQINNSPKKTPSVVLPPTVV
jgi:hypothetical protein